MTDSSSQLPLFWAKTDRKTGDPLRSVQEHSFHAGCVARCLCNVWGAFGQKLLPVGAATLTAAHDIGKLTIGFQLKSQIWSVPDAWCETIRAQNAVDSIGAHASMSERDLKRRLGIASSFARAVGAHHGWFASALSSQVELMKEQFLPLRDSLMEQLIQEFGPLPKERCGSDALLAVFAGFVVLADWIASDEDFFPLGRKDQFGTPFTDAAKEDAEQRACDAVTSLQLATPRLKPSLPFDAYNPFMPSELQKAALKHITGPGLYIVEAAMGKGKTEAALAAAYQVISSGQARGFYFALPTQLTSNEIHRRTRDIFGRVVEDTALLPLSHSASWLTRVESLAIHPADADDEESQDHVRAARAWLTSRKSLLSPFGVGTIDQALMGALPVKFAHLRMLGLAGKVVIFDEVHSYDAYTGTVLRELIKQLMELHCTVIILSATLTHQLRLSLLSAATDVPQAESESEDWKGYPLLSVARPGEPAQPIPIEPEKDDERRTVQVRHLTLDEPTLPAELLAEIEDKVSAGFCVLIIRNTVPLAQATYKQMKTLLRQSDEAEQVGLLHSRFPFYQRFGHPDRPNETGREAQWVARLGKNRKIRPNGCVVVSTQVCEMSVDIDADWLISDLCPTDQLLQRIGRLHRHKEPRCTGGAQAEVVILHPAPPQASEPTAKDWQNSLKPHGILYAPYVLLRTQAVWQKQSIIVLPTAIRPLLKTTYSQPEQPESDAWQKLEKEMTDEIGELRQTAEQFSRDRTKPAGKDEEHFAPTRWNDLPTLELVLLAKKPDVQAGGAAKLLFLDQTEATWRFGEKWQSQTAKYIFVNTLRLPAYMWPKTEIKPDWLADYTHGLAGAAWVSASGVLMSCSEELELPLRYCCNEGVAAVAKPKVRHNESFDLLVEDDQEGMG